MLNIAEELKTIYRNDLLPIVAKNAPKDLEIHFPSLGLYILTDQILDDSFELNEKLCSEDDLVFGSCEASQIKFTVADVAEDLTGLEFTINQIVSDIHVVPLGKYKVDSCKKQDDLRFKDIIAYDAIKSTDINVADWYNGLFPLGTETYTLKQFRSSLLTHLGIMEEAQTLPNDDMVVEKTIEPTQISGRDVLKATVELNGAFGHINREGKFIRKVLQPSYGLYPAETLYPAEDLYPVSESDTSYAHESIIDENVSKAMYQSVRFEEYTVKEIDKLQIRAEENDIGAIVGIGTNTYVIEGNFLVYGKSASQLEQIALNIYGNIAKRPYRPFEAQSIGLPYVEVGDSLEIATDDVVVGYVLQRTLTGIQALRDTYIAKGNEEREQNFGVNKEIVQLQGKVTRIKKDVEGVSVEVEDLANDTASKFTQTAELIELRVEKNGVISAINQSAEEIKISANKINLQGYVTITSLTTPGAVEIDGGNLKAGTVIADGVTAEWVYAGEISADQIHGGEITGVKITSSGQYGTVTLDKGGLIGDYVYATAGGFGSVSVGSVSITSSNVSTPSINGYIPITSGNIGSQSVNYASSSGSASIAGFADSANSANSANRATTAYGLNSGGSGAVYVSSNGNLRPSSSGGRSCGTSGGLWSSVWAVNGTIQTSDEREKTDIKLLDEDERFIRFAKKIAPYSFKMVKGTSGRNHTGFIAQRIEKAMAECEISDMEFAGLIKAPVFAEKLKDDEGNDTDEYDTTSEIIDYTYHLRYDEFVPLLFLWIRSLNID